jgi:hypothetical protein
MACRLREMQARGGRPVSGQISDSRAFQSRLRGGRGRRPGWAHHAGRQCESRDAVEAFAAAGAVVGCAASLRQPRSIRYRLRLRHRCVNGGNVQRPAGGTGGDTRSAATSRGRVQRGRARTAGGHWQIQVPADRGLNAGQGRLRFSPLISRRAAADARCDQSCGRKRPRRRP